MEPPLSLEDYIDYIFPFVMFVTPIVMELTNTPTKYLVAFLSTAFAVYKILLKRTCNINDDHFNDPKILK